MSFETFKENRFNVSYVLKTAIAYCTQFLNHIVKKIWCSFGHYQRNVKPPIQHTF